jgi:hypothetical protein
MEDDINYWFNHRDRLVDALFKQHFYGVGGEKIKAGNFWWLIVRILNNKVSCGCDWCLRIYSENEHLLPINPYKHSLYCLLTCSLNSLLEKYELPILDPYSGCILDPSGEGDFMIFEEGMLSNYKDIENKIKFNIFMNKMEHIYIEYQNKYKKLKNVKSETPCGICLEKIENLGKELPCEHAFHESCIQNWLKIRKNCPLCRCYLKKKGEDKFGDWLISQIDVEKE